MPQTTIITQLQQLFPPQRILSAAEDLEHYGRDWTRLTKPAPSAIVFPQSSEEVQKLIHWANQTQTALVPSGGRTGLSGGAVAYQGEVVVALDKMQKIINFNPIDRTLHCQAGVITQHIQDYASKHDLFYPVNFASAGSSQIGGNVATNAGGVRVIRYGNTRQWIAGLHVVTGKGDILELNRGLIKNATGYDLRHLMIGSEGTLGIITEVIVQLTRPLKNRAVLVLGAQTLQAVIAIFQLFNAHIDLTAFEFFSELALTHVLAKHALQRPFASTTPYYALLEFADADKHSDAAMACFEKGMAHGHILDGIMSQTEMQAENLWQLRENITESLSDHSPYKDDLAVRVSQLTDFLPAIEQALQTEQPDLTLVWFGHIGDGNVHLNILKPENLSLAAFAQHCHTLNQTIMRLVQQYQGAVSAEHGIGLLKKPYLAFSRSPEEIAYMRALKHVFDPNNILNPGKLLVDTTQEEAEL